jgi:hypothetical protein
MDTPNPRAPLPLPQSLASEAKMQAWLELRHELEQLHAQLQYLKLLQKLGVGKL